MNDLLFELLKTVIIVAIGIVVRYLVPWIKLKIEGTKLKEIIAWGYKFVQAAEQTIIGGTDKKTYVTERLKELLKQKNITLSNEQISALIEGIVNELYPHMKQEIK